MQYIDHEYLSHLFHSEIPKQLFISAELFFENAINNDEALLKHPLNKQKTKFPYYKNYQSNIKYDSQPVYFVKKDNNNINKSKNTITFHKSTQTYDHEFYLFHSETTQTNNKAITLSDITNNIYELTFRDKKYNKIIHPRNYIIQDE